MRPRRLTRSLGGTVTGVPVVVSTASAAAALSDSTPSFDVPVPPGAQPGDTVYMVIKSQASTGTAHWSHAAATLVSPAYAFTPANQTAYRVFDILQFELGEAIPESYEMTRPQNSGSSRAEALTILVRGALPGAVVTAINTGTIFAGYSVPGGRSTLTLIAATCEVTPNNSHVPLPAPAGWDDVVSGVSPADRVIASQSGTAVRVIARAGLSVVPQVDAGFVGPTLTAPCVIGLTIRWDPTTPQPFESFTVADMDAMISSGQTVYVAHRGGSRNYSEMTMRAYDSARWRTPVLECSAHMSQDGVWIMSHDADLERVTGIEPAIVIADTPAADMIGLPVIEATTGGVIGTLVELLSTYPGLVLWLDDKTLTGINDFCETILAYVPDARNHVVIKIDGWAALGRFQAAKSYGFKVAGYWGNGDISTLGPARMPYTDYVGMNFDASDEDWAVALSFGKPVWGHILNTRAAAVATVARGASIIMAADILDIIPPR